MTLDSARVAQYLADHPRFFEDYADLLSEVKLSSAVRGRTISLSERQMEIMRAKGAALELKLANLSIVASANAALVQRFQRWTHALLQQRDSTDLPRTLLDALQTAFNIPCATLRLWSVAPPHASAWFAQDVLDDAKLFANGLRTPYCGGNKDFDAVRWLGPDPSVASTALIALRGADGVAFGLLVLGAPEASRFEADMATDFLVDLGATASAALHALRA